MIHVHRLDCDCGKCRWMSKIERGKLLKFKGVNMLVLSIVKGKRFFVGDAEIRILEVGRSRVRIGITAPKEIEVKRERNSGTGLVSRKEVKDDQS